VSELMRQIEQCMCNLVEGPDDELTARFLFPTGFIGFQGHFPGRPVLPAVCNIQAAIAMLEAWKETDVSLDEIISAKFAAPIGDDEEVLLRCSVASKDGRRAVVKTTVEKGSASVARFKLRVTFGGQGRA